jgi:hypothetical protein
VPLHQLLHELEGGSLVPLLRDEGLQHLALVVYGAPEVAHLALHADVDLVQVPAPMRVLAHAVHPALADLGGEHGTKAVHPGPDRLMADVDAALEGQVLHVSK